MRRCASDARCSARVRHGGRRQAGSCPLRLFIVREDASCSVVLEEMIELGSDVAGRRLGLQEDFPLPRQAMERGDQVIDSRATMVVLVVPDAYHGALIGKAMRCVRVYSPDWWLVVLFCLQ